MAAADDSKLDEILALLREIRAAQPAVPKAWMTPEEAAVYLRLSRSRVYEYVRSGGMPGHYLPDSNLIRIHRDELDEWVKSARHKTDQTTINIKRKMRE